MRHLLFITIIGLLLTSCSEKETLTLNQELLKMSTPSQIFTVTNTETDTIEARNGTRIIIPPGAFTFKSGQEVNGPVQIELKEVFDKSEIIVNGLNTVSDGRLLESLGMIYLNATSDAEEMVLKDSIEIAVLIPNKSKGVGGELFYGARTDSTFNWKFAGSNKDITIVSTIIRHLAYGPDSITQTTYKVVNGERQLIPNNKGDLAEEDSPTIIPPFYKFGVKKLGWINCDRFITLTKKTNLEIEIKEFEQPQGYLVFSELNSVMKIYFNQNGTAVVNDLPDNYSVDVVVIDKINGTFMWVKKGIKTGTETKVTLDTKKISKEKLSDEFTKLNQ